MGAATIRLRNVTLFSVKGLKSADKVDSKLECPRPQSTRKRFRSTKTNDVWAAEKALPPIYTGNSRDAIGSHNGQTDDC